MKKLLLSAALALSFHAAQAVTLVNDTAVALPGTTVAAEPQLAGTVLVDKLTDFTIAGEGITGHIKSRGVRSSLDGTLDFYWRVFNDPTSRGNVGNFRIGEFIAPEYNANWRIDGLGDVAPNSAYMFGGTYAGRGYINFQFFDAASSTGTLMPGQSSYFIFLDTTATSYSENALMDVANMSTTEISELLTTFGPSAVPEPSTYAMLGLGLAAMALVRRRRGG